MVQRLHPRVTMDMDALGSYVHISDYEEMKAQRDVALEKSAMYDNLCNQFGTSNIMGLIESKQTTIDNLRTELGQYKAKARNAEVKVPTNAEIAKAWDLHRRAGEPFWCELVQTRNHVAAVIRHLLDTQRKP